MGDDSFSGFRVMRPVGYKDCKRTIVALGSPRGGTSMLSGVLEKLGVFMGNRIGSQKEDPRFRYKESLEIKIKAIEDNVSEFDVWGWKLPKTVYYYESIHEYLVNPVFITVYRNPLAIASSSASRDGRPFSQRLLDVPVNHYAKIHKLTDKYSEVPLAVCSFEDIAFRDKKRQFIDGLIDFMGIDVTQDKRELAIEFVDYSRGYRD